MAECPKQAMTERLKQAVEQASRQLSPEDQDYLADRILALLRADDDATWDAAFAASGDKFDKLAQRALDNYRAGRTEPLDPDKL